MDLELVVQEMNLHLRSGNFEAAEECFYSLKEWEKERGSSPESYGIYHQVHELTNYAVEAYSSEQVAYNYWQRMRDICDGFVTLKVRIPSGAIDVWHISSEGIQAIH